MNLSILFHNLLELFFFDRWFGFYNVRKGPIGKQFFLKKNFKSKGKSDGHGQGVSKKRVRIKDQDQGVGDGWGEGEGQEVGDG